MSEAQSDAVILVVDDAPENIDVLVGILRPHYKVKVARDGQKALKIAGGDKPPQAILLDVLMPEMDGWQVCEQLKAGPGTAGIPVIFCSGLTSEEEMAKGKALGALGFVQKPVDPDKVLRAVRSAL